MRSSELLILALLVGCRQTPPDEKDSGSVDTGGPTDTDPPDSGDTGDTDTGETGETADTDDSDSDDTGIDTDTAPDETADTAEDTGLLDTAVLEDLDTAAVVSIDVDDGIGMKMTGENANGTLTLLGFHEVALGSPGDANGDGSDDVLIGLSGAGRSGEAHGIAYIVNGPAISDSSLSVVTDALYGQVPSPTGESLGAAVSFVGDTNGDGYDDILVGAPSLGNFEGGAYLFLGPNSGIRTSADADSMFIGESDADDGFAGMSLGPAGDVNGDGYADVIVGAEEHAAVYVVHGPVPATVDLATDANTRIYTFGVGLAESVATAGDVNGDGLSDIVFESHIWGAGAVLFFGPAEGELAEGDQDASLLCDLDDGCGDDVRAAGDVDADGYPDLVVASRSDDDSGNASGAAYLAAGPFGGDLDLPTHARAKMIGANTYDQVGSCVDGLGDLDADGHDDLLIGAQGATSDAGAAYVLLGPVAGTFLPSAADYAILGQDNTNLGTNLRAAGDVDADGIPDLLLAAPRDDDGGTDAGAVWFIPGANLLAR